MVQIWHPTSAETRMLGKQPAAMLAIYTSRGVAPQLNLRNVYHIRLCSSNKVETTLALKPRGDITRSLKQGYQWPQKWTCVQQKFLKKRKKDGHAWQGACVAVGMCMAEGVRGGGAAWHTCPPL